MGLNVNSYIALFLFINLKLYFNEILNPIKKNIYYSKILLSRDHYYNKINKQTKPILIFNT